MSVTSRIRAVIGALGVLACASPLSAQNHRHPVPLRYAAQWVGRGRIAALQASWAGPRWRGVGRPWRGAVVAGPWRRAEFRRAWVAPGPYWRRPIYRRAYGYGRPFYGRPWARGGGFRMMRYRPL